MLRVTPRALKKGFTIHPSSSRRGAKNAAWMPKIASDVLSQFVPLTMEHPPRRPNNWQRGEFHRLGMIEWPKEVGFFNAGDNFELTPEMMWRLFQRNKDEAFWKPTHNESVVVHQMPLVERDPAAFLPRCDAVMRHHVARFGPDHTIYNAVMQAAAFAKDMARCTALFREMETQELVPNAQSYVNLMLAVNVCGLPRERAFSYFEEGTRSGAFQPVMRLDTEFQMWWDQIQRMGSFTSAASTDKGKNTRGTAATDGDREPLAIPNNGGGFLASAAVGAKPRPRDLWALWGWDRDERKFIGRRQRIRQQIAQQAGGGEFAVTLYKKHQRQPWYKYRGMTRDDFIAPFIPLDNTANYKVASTAPPATFNDQQCGPITG